MRLVVLSFLALVAYSRASRILAFFPLAAKSHHYVFRPILEALGRRGHDVVYVTGYPYEGTIPPGIVQTDISQYMPKLHDEINLMDLVDDSVLGSALKVYELTLKMATYYLGNPPVQELIHSNQKFDAVLFESYVYQEYVSGFIHKFGAVGIDVLPLGDFCWMDELTGTPCNPAYQLDVKSELTQNMGFFQRLYNTYVITVATFAGYYHLHRMQTLVDSYFNYTGWESRPPIAELLSNRSLILTNSHYIVGYPALLASNRKEIGGVNILPNKPLPKAVQSFMDDSYNGVIYFSLGSNINVSHPANDNIRRAFMKVFEEIPQRVLMKWENDYPGELPKNVKLEKWFPQQDVLAHKNCVLFITHGGYLSLTEAVHFGVPVIGIPFFGDQAKNFHFAEEAGIGKMLRIKEITYETASKTVKEVLSNSSYKEEMVRRSEILRDRRQPPAEEAVHWIEHSIKYPNVLRPRGATLSFLQLHLVDVQLFIVAVLLSFVIAVRKALAAVARLFAKKAKAPPKIKRN